MQYNAELCKITRITHGHATLYNEHNIHDLAAEYMVIGYHGETRINMRKYRENTWDMIGNGRKEDKVNYGYLG